MENPFKPAKRTRDPSVFAKAPVVKPAAQKTRARYTALQQSLLDRQIPPRMVRYITQHFHAKAKIDAFVELYRKGCHLTGRQFGDRYDPKDPQPDACVPRKDGTLVCLPVHALSQEGKIPDALLLAAARALVAHADRRPHAPVRPATPPPTLPEEPTYDSTSSLLLGPRHQELLPGDSDPAGQREPAVTSHGAGKWEWDDSAAAVVFSPI